MLFVKEQIRSKRIMSNLLDGFAEDGFTINFFFRLSKQSYAIFATPKQKISVPEALPEVN